MSDDDETKRSGSRRNWAKDSGHLSFETFGPRVASGIKGQSHFQTLLRSYIKPLRSLYLLDLNKQGQSRIRAQCLTCATFGPCNWEQL